MLTYIAYCRSKYLLAGDAILQNIALPDKKMKYEQINSILKLLDLKL